MCRPGTDRRVCRCGASGHRNGSRRESREEGKGGVWGLENVYGGCRQGIAIDGERKWTGRGLYWLLGARMVGSYHEEWGAVS